MKLLRCSVEGAFYDFAQFARQQMDLQHEALSGCHMTGLCGFTLRVEVVVFLSVEVHGS